MCVCVHAHTDKIKYARFNFLCYLILTLTLFMLIQMIILFIYFKPKSQDIFINNGIFFSFSFVIAFIWRDNSREEYLKLRLSQEIWDKQLL